MTIDARIVEARDVRMLEGREDVAFVRQTLGQRAAANEVRQLERDVAPGPAIRAIGQPHGAHTATAQLEIKQ